MESKFPNFPKRVVAYVDGFNLYFGLKAAGFQRYYWLNIYKLARNLIKEDQELVESKYFTARISGPSRFDKKEELQEIKDRVKRQTRYLDALLTLERFKLYEGQYLKKHRKCSACGFKQSTHEEKMTDVNIATELVVDAFEDKFDMALVISGDSDLTPPIKVVRDRFPQKQIIVAFPPKRHSYHLKTIANHSFTIGRAALRDSQLPNVVQSTGGENLVKPSEWN